MSNAASGLPDTPPGAGSLSVGRAGNGSSPHSEAHATRSLSAANRTSTPAVLPNDEQCAFPEPIGEGPAAVQPPPITQPAVSPAAAAHPATAPPESQQPHPTSTEFTAETLVMGHTQDLSGQTVLQLPQPPLKHPVVHPQGFRVLSNASVVERTLRGYFRLPPAPSAELQEERRRVQQSLLQMEKREAAQAAHATGGVGSVILDGFLLLSAASSADPRAVEAVTLQNSHLCSSVPEDLEYFSNLRFLDVSENALAVEDLVALPALETLHIPCNGIRSLAGLQDAARCGTVAEQRRAPSASLRWGTGTLLGDEEPEATVRSAPVHVDVLLPSLVALNLSYNRVPSEHVCLLSYFPCLEKLDLSGNGLHELPEDLSCLTSVTHFALENNAFAVPHRPCRGDTRGRGTRGNVFLSLSTMPSLVEVNLNHNKLRLVPDLSVQDGSGLCFPSIEVIGLSHNELSSVESVLPLASLHRTLRRVVLSSNPISHSAKKMRQARMTFEQCIIDAYCAQLARDEELQLQSHGNQGGSKRSLFSSRGTMDDTDTANWRGQSWTRLLPTRDDLPADTADVVPGGSITDVSAAALAAAKAAAATAEDEREAPSSTSSASISPAESLPTERPGRSAGLRSDGGGIPLSERRSARDADDGYRSASFTETASVKEYYPTVEAYVEAHHVTLVFNDAQMPKHDLRHFYATQTLERGESTLVTIPEYKEFMDIYRITGRSKERVQQHRRPHHPRASRRAPTAASPPTSRAGVDNTTPIYAEEELNTQSNGDRTPDDGQRSDCGAAGADDDAAFFLTELDGPVGALGGRGGPSAEERKVGERVSASGPDRQTTNRNSPGTSVRGAAAGTAAAPPLPPIVSATTTNVHSAVQELKALLRRPLVPLPYASTKTAQGSRAHY